MYTKYKTYQTLVEKPHSKFLRADIDQIFISQQWQQSTFIKTPTTTKANILYNLTEEQWDRFCYAYISDKLHNPPPFQTHPT